MVIDGPAQRRPASSRRPPPPPSRGRFRRYRHSSRLHLLAPLTLPVAFAQACSTPRHQTSCRCAPAPPARAAAAAAAHCQRYPPLRCLNACTYRPCPRSSPAPAPSPAKAPAPTPAAGRCSSTGAAPPPASRPSRLATCPPVRKAYAAHLWPGVCLLLRSCRPTVAPRNTCRPGPRSACRRVGRHAAGVRERDRDRGAGPVVHAEPAGPCHLLRWHLHVQGEAAGPTTAHHTQCG